MSENDPFQEFISRLDLDGFEELSCDVTRTLLDDIFADKSDGGNLWGDYITQEQIDLRRCLTCKLSAEVFKNLDAADITPSFLMNLITTAITWGYIAQNENRDGV